MASIHGTQKRDDWHGRGGLRVVPDPGWFVFDGFYEPVDGPYGSIDEAEAAATDFLAAQDPGEDHNTIVAHSYDGGETFDTEQPWRCNQDEVAA